MGNNVALEAYRILPAETRKTNYLTECYFSLNYSKLKHNSIDCLLTRIRRSVEVAPRCGEHRVADVPYFRIHLLLQSPEWKLLEEELRETYDGLEIGNLALWQHDDDNNVIWDLTFNLRTYSVEK